MTALVDPTHVALSVVNIAALLALVVALARLKARHADRTETGRALMVTLTAVLVMGLAGIARRTRLEHADEAATLAWVAVLAAAVWAATFTPTHRD